MNHNCCPPIRTLLFKINTSYTAMRLRFTKIGERCRWIKFAEIQIFTWLILLWTKTIFEIINTNVKAIQLIAPLKHLDIAMTQKVVDVKRHSDSGTHSLQDRITVIIWAGLCTFDETFLPKTFFSFKFRFNNWYFMMWI